MTDTPTPLPMTLSEAQAEVTRLRAEVGRCHKRLEITHVWRLKPGSEDAEDMERIDVPMPERATMPDAVECRDATIELLEEDLATLRASEARMREALGQAALDVLAERTRQVSAEGWTPEHDDQHDHGQMAGAALCYIAEDIPHWARQQAHGSYWPWDAEWWKPTDHRRNLVKAGALILAEIERLDRAALQGETK